MRDLLDSIKVNGSYIMNTTVVFIGIFASFLSASVKKRIQIAGLIVLAFVFNALTWLVYENKDLLYWTIFFTAIWIIVCLILICNKEIVSRRKIDKMIRDFTENADQNEPICIFGGDLDFFGDYTVDVKWWDKFLKNSNVIQCNKQFNQLKKKGFKKVRILNVKPEGDSDRDLKARIRIGFLKKELKRNLEIKFFEVRECNTCDERLTCLTCAVCARCPEGKKCKRTKRYLCEKLENHYQNRCYNPDTQLRGRIAKKKNDGSTSAAIVTTYKAGKSYILKEYSSNTKECTIYQNIWDVWWRKCKTDDEFIRKCIADYNEFKRKSI